MAHWVLINMKKIVVHEFDTNVGGGAAAELAAARPIAQVWAAENLMKVSLCSAVRLITPIFSPPPPTAQDDPYPNP